MITILLARHGQASFGQENYDQLSEHGIQQAKLLGEHYANAQRPINAVFSGSLMRQRDSALHFCAAYNQHLVGDNSNPISINTDNAERYILPLFNEFNHEDVFIKSNPNLATQAQIAAQLAHENKPISKLGELFGLAMQRWHTGDYDDEYLESWPQFSRRALNALEVLQAQIANIEHLNEDSTVIVFTSGGVIAAITSYLLKQGSSTAYQLTQSSVNTGVTCINIYHKKLQLISYNEHSHLFVQGKNLITRH